MIRYIEGVVLHIEADSVVVNVQGIGHKVCSTPDTLVQIGIGDTVRFHTHLAVRENALDLYGFMNKKELTLFELLLTVSGIGPKSALSVLSLASPEILQSTVRDQNPAHLTKVTGIGKKTAEKIVMELKEKVALFADATPTTHGDEEALEALRSMGYTLQEAREALKRVPRDIAGSSARLREALKGLAQ